MDEQKEMAPNQEAQELINRLNREAMKGESPLPEAQAGIPIRVSVDLKARAVVIAIGAGQVTMSIQGSREFALALRQAANLIEQKTS